MGKQAAHVTIGFTQSETDPYAWESTLGEAEFLSQDCATFHWDGERFKPDEKP